MMDYKYTYYVKANHEGKTIVSVTNKIRPKDDDYVTITFKDLPKATNVEWDTEGNMYVNGEKVQ